MTEHSINILLIEPKVQRAARLLYMGHDVISWTHVLRAVDAVDILDQGHKPVYAVLYAADRIDMTDAQRRRFRAGRIPLLAMDYLNEEAVIIQDDHWPYKHYIPLAHALTAELFSQTIRGMVENHRLRAEQGRLNQHYADMEHQFSNMIADNPDGILIVDDNGHIVFANQQAAAIFDTTITRLTGRDFGYPLTTDRMTSLDIHHRDGRIVYVEMQASETTWQGQPAVVATLHDVTRRKEEERNLYQLRLLHVSVFNSVTERIAVLDGEGRIIATNRAWDDAARRNGDPELKYTGTGVDYFAACRTAQGDMSEGADTALHGMLDVLHGRRDIFEMEYQDIENNVPEWYMMRVTRLRDELGSGLVVVHSNISYGKQTARKQAEYEAALSQYRLRQKEMAALRELGEHSAARSTPHVLRQTAPDVFEELVQRFESLLNRAFEQRTHKIKDSISDDLRRLADYLGTLRVGPREVMDLYLKALKRSTETAPPPKVQAYTEEGRILVLELMGYLATFYRDALPPTVRLSAL